MVILEHELSLRLSADTYAKESIGDGTCSVKIIDLDCYVVTTQEMM